MSLQTEVQLVSKTQLCPSGPNTVLWPIPSLVAAAVCFVVQPVVNIPQCLDHHTIQPVAPPRETHPVPSPQQQIHSLLNHICKMKIEQ